MIRRCESRDGRDWTETCTLYDAGRRHAVEVDPEGYPYPLEVVGCLSYVEPTDGGHRVGLVFQMQPRSGLAGHVMVLCMHAGRPVLRRVVRGWVRSAGHSRPQVVIPAPPS